MSFSFFVRTCDTREKGALHRARRIKCLAQSVEHKALNLVVVGSSPTVGACWVLGFFTTQSICIHEDYLQSKEAECRLRISPCPVQIDWGYLYP